MRRQGAWTLTIGLLTSGLGVYLASRQVEWRALVTTLKRADGRWLALGAMLNLLEYGLLSLRWRTLLGSRREVSLREAFEVTMVSHLVGLLSWARFGDVARAMIAGRVRSTGTSLALGVITVERLLDVGMLATLAIGLSVVAPLPVFLRRPVAIAALVALGGLAAVLVLTGSRGAVLAGPRARLPGVPTRVRAWMAEVLARFREGLGAARAGPVLPLGIVLSGAIWTLSILSAACTLAALQLSAPWYALGMVILLVNLGGAVPSAPGGIGVFHYLAVVALSPWVGDPTSALGFAVVHHGLWVTLGLAVGGMCLLRSGIRWRPRTTHDVPPLTIPDRRRDDAHGPRPPRATPADWAAVSLLIVGNYVLRKYLEGSDARIRSFMDSFYPGVMPALLQAGPWWRLFLPLPELTGSWTTTTLVLTYFVERILSPPTTWYLFNAILIAASFAISWSVLRSRTFSYTLALCMGFGTQLHHTYAVPGSLGFPLLFVYYELLLLCAYRVLETATPPPRWKTAFVGLLAVTMLAYEGWLDFLVFAWLAWAYLAVILRGAGLRSRLPGLNFLGISVTLAGLVHTVVKIRLGYGQVPGSESDLVLNYGHLAPAAEDILSNALTHLYIAATNFLPPGLVWSTALYRFGAGQLAGFQEGYHPSGNHLVPLHYLFLWRYSAGAVSVLFAYWLVRAIRRSRASWSPDHLGLALCLLMVVVGSPTHTLIKFRPMNSAPVLGYHVMVGVLGMSLLVSHALMLVRRRGGRGLGSAAVVAAAWLLILYGALTRPAWLGYFATLVGVASAEAYPDPWRVLVHLLWR